MYQLFIANKLYSSWSLRPWILMRELDIPFTEQVVPFASDSNWEEFRRFSPVGKVPCLHDAETVIWDSMGIIEYLADRFPEVWPKEAKARAWARCAAAEMHSGFQNLRNACGMHISLRIKMNQVSAAVQRDIERINELWNEGLSRFGGPFLAGDKFTAIDAFFAPVVFRVQTYGLKMDAPSTAYAQHILALPSMQLWQADALKEEWSEPNHELEAKAAGEVIEDKRKAQ